MTKEEIEIVADALKIAMGKATVAGVDKVDVPNELAQAAITALDQHREGNRQYWRDSFSAMLAVIREDYSASPIPKEEKPGD